MSFDILVDPAQRERELQAQKTQDDTLESELKTVQSKVPEKYRGKTVEEVAEIADSIEKEKSRLGNELGTTRKQYADLLERQVKETTKEEPPKQITADEVLTNPGEAIEQAIRQSPTVKKVLEQSTRDHGQREYDTFVSKYPTFKEDIADKEFLDWVQKSPVRANLASAADQMDFNAATALWGLWDERKEMLKEVTEAKAAKVKADRAKQLKDGELESGTGSGSETKKYFNRREIIDLKARAKNGDRVAEATVSDPAWQKEVNAAYASGRVR